VSPARRRLVRPLPEFFDQLDQLLGEDRGPRGEPSQHDFLSIELPPILESFATGWDTLMPLIPGRADYRVLIGTGRYIYAYAVEGQLTPSGEIELVRLEIQVTGPPGEPAG
jgi:hypothetical protein